jgi:PST family polysaccharide transporter
MITVFLGPKWKSAVIVFRLLAPTVLAFAIINPMGWLLMSLGLVGRGLKLALVLAPFMIAGYIIGLPYGPKGVACAYSAMMTVSAIPLIAGAVRGTVISLRDILLTVSRPLFSGIVAAAVALGLQVAYGPFLSPLPRLILGVALVLSGYLGMLLYVMGQKLFYLNLIRGLTKPLSVDEPLVASG